MDDFRSNRPYTLFYYPSSLLLPLAMSEHKLRQLWCLLDSDDPKEAAFPVDASLDWNVYQLIVAIQGHKAVLRESDTSDIALWKVRVLSYSPA